MEEPRAAVPTPARILILVRTLKVGGMERVAVDLADAMAEAGHECHVMYFKRRRDELRPAHPAVRVHAFDLTAAIRRAGIGVLVELASRLLNLVWRKSRFLWIGGIGGRVLRRRIESLEREFGRFDRLVFRGQGTFEEVWSLRDERARYVLENVVHDRGSGWRPRLAARRLYDGRHLVGVSAGVVESLRAAAARLGFAPASLRVITNPCPVARIRERMLLPEPGLPTGPYLVNVARLVDQKDHALLLEAYARARPAEPLVIVGDGPLRAELERHAARLGLGERVRFAGLRKNPYPWMHHARLFVLSSKFEGLGIVLLESLACGTPVLAVDCPGGVRDVLRGELAGSLAPHSAEGLASKLCEVLAAPRAEVRPEWLEPFTPERVVRAFLAE